jgi:hypothetical protein
MRALASVDAGVIKAEIEIAASPERVFRALTDPTELAAWWGDSMMYRTYDWQMAYPVKSRYHDGFCQTPLRRTNTSTAFPIARLCCPARSVV